MATLRSSSALLAGLLALSALHCASNKNSNKGEEVLEEDRGASDPTQAGGGPRTDAMPSVTYADTADENWRLGEEAFSDEDFQIAQRYYTYIRSKFPYSRFTADAEIRIGDCQFERGRFLEAIDSYQNFARLHPTHEKVAYAMYRIGVSYKEQIPDDWFILPPSEEKEQTAVKDAERALKEYVERFPQDKNLEEGKKILTDVRKRLLAHERYAANFYKSIDRDRAYVGRLEVIRKDFKDVGLDDELLFDIVTVWSKLGDAERAKSALAELEQQFPKSERIATARARAGAVKEAPKPAATPEAKPEPTNEGAPPEAPGDVSERGAVDPL